MWSAMCDNPKCFAYTEAFKTKKEVVECWNNRPAEEAKTARIAELEQENRELLVKCERMLILLHDSRGNELIVNTDIIATVKEERSNYPTTGLYILSTTTGGEITIKESPREVKSLQDQAAKKARGEA